MSFQKELDEAQGYLKSAKMIDRKKALDKFTNLLQNENVIPLINNNDPFSWSILLEDAQNCLKKECDRVADNASKRGPPKVLDKNVELAVEFLVLIVKTSIQGGEAKIEIPALINYVEGCLREKKMKYCRDYFLRMIKDYVLPNPNCLGTLEQKDFITLFTLMKSEFNRCSLSEPSREIVFNCFSLLIEYGPLAAFPSRFLREQFSFISKLCQSITHNNPRIQQEHVVKIALNFCKHTAEDNRLSCLKFGEEVFSTLLDLYCHCGHDSGLKVSIVEMFLLQIVIHNPNGSLENNEGSLASNWYNWKACIKKMYALIIQEISQYLKQSVKNTLFFIPREESFVILDSFVMLFVEVCMQLFNEEESPMNYLLPDNLGLNSQSQKRRKVDASLESFISEIHDTKCWVWIKLVGALLERYPNLINKQLFIKLLNILHKLQLEVTDNKTIISYIYETQAILIDIESCIINIGDDSQLTTLWKLVGDSTLRAVGLNQNIKETQTLLQKLINRNIVNVESVIQTYTSGVLTITEHHVNTLALVLKHINFSQIELSTKEKLFDSLLNPQNVKDYTCFLKKYFADVLVALTLKQCPDLNNTSAKKQFNPYQTLIELYAKNNFNPECLTDNKVNTNCVVTKRTFNIDCEAVNVLTEKLTLFVNCSEKELIDKLLCIVGLLYNVLSSMIDYQIIQTLQIDQCQVTILMKQILSNERIMSLQRYQTQNEKMLKNLFKLAKILNALFSLKNSVTGVVKQYFKMEFLQEVTQTLNFFQYAPKKSVEHKVRKALTKVLSKYSLVSNSAVPTKCQCQIMLLFSTPDYDFSNDANYDLGLSFLRSIKLANAEFLPNDVIGNVLNCLHELCSVRYRSYRSAVDILSILCGLYPHIKGLDNDEYKNTAVQLLYPFYRRRSYYGPDVVLLVLDCIEALCRIDPNCIFTKWDDKEVIKYVPQFLASDFQRVRYRAVQVLVQFLKMSTGTTQLEAIHRIEEIFESICESNIKVFEVEGDLTDERRHDEILFRASSALYTFVSIIVNCNSWIEESLFDIIKLDYKKKLFNISNGELIKKVFRALQNHFGSEDFFQIYVENILTKWINLGYDINEFQYKIFGCPDKKKLYIKYFDICVPLLLKKDKDDLFAAARELDMTEKDVLERCCTRIFGRALTADLSNLGDQFTVKNSELSYVSRILGSRFKENLIENIDQVISGLVNAITDEKAIAQFLGETVFFTSRNISYSDFKKCLGYVEAFLCDGDPLIKFLCNAKMDKIQKIILDLERRIYSTSEEQQLTFFHQYTVFLELILKHIESGSALFIFFLRDTIYFLVHLTKNTIQNRKLSKAILRYISHFLRIILPAKSSEFQQFLIFTVNSFKNIAIDNDHLSALCIEILEFIIIDNTRSLQNAIEKLDTFPLTPEFDNIRKVHTDVKYGNKDVSVQEEIESFLEYNDISTRQDSLIHLRAILSKDKNKVKLLYDKLKEIRGFSEDCEKSLLHKLTSMLIKMSCYPNEKISGEAIKCLGELGPADLTTIVLEPEKRVLDIKCTPFQLLTGHVVSLLTQNIVDSDINVVYNASAALYEILKFKDGKQVVGSNFDFGYGPIDKHFVTPYMNNPQKTSSHIRIKLQKLTELNDTELWCPSEVVENKEWVTSLVLTLLNCFDYGCYLNTLAGICKVKAKFCEDILPLLIYLLLSLNSDEATNILSKQLNEFFSQHWRLTVSTSTDKNLIAVNKKSVKCVLDVINFIRQQPTISKKLGNLKLDYLPIAKAAAFCSAHFSALLYAELWCQEQVARIEINNPRGATPFENGFTLLDHIYEHVSKEIGITLQQILQSSYKSIGDFDALSGCGISLLLRPEHRVEYYKNTGQWGHVMNYYSMQPICSSESNQASLIQSFKMNQLYQLPVLCENLSAEPQYECLWRLGQWNLSKRDNGASGMDSKNYDKYKFYSLKALCDNDQYTYNLSKNQLNSCIVEDLKHTSLESSKNLYPTLSRLESLIEMDDCINAVDTDGFEEVLNKWRAQDMIIRKNDFQFVEPIAAQRMTILGEFTKKNPGLKKAYFGLVLDFVDYAKEECQIRVAENALINIRKIPDLDSTIENELQFREAQLAWLNDDKVIAQHLLRKLCKATDTTPRLKANCLKLQGVYMAEMYSDRNSILNSFNASIKMYDQIHETLSTEDRQHLQDTHDKIATFADREYQQIMNHIKSDLFQKKISNVESCKEIASVMKGQKRKSKDEERAQIIHERQIKIDENEINTTLKEKESVLGLALKFYIKNISSCDTNNIKIFRVMSLFLENRDNKNLVEQLKNMIPLMSTYKYITMLPQLIPHISTNPHDAFGQQINEIIEKCAIDHPHHTLPLLLALVNANKDKEYTKSKSFSNDRSPIAAAFLKRLQKHASLNNIIDKMLKLSEALIELAYYVDDTNGDKTTEFKIPSGLKIRKILDFDDILVPTYTLPVSKNNTYSELVGIVKFSSKFKTVGGINVPKRIECVCTQGKNHSQLVKGQDDLRQDAVMQQVFMFMTNLLSTNRQTKSLLIRTYKIVPLSMRSGILEWVANSMPIGNYLAGDKDTNYIGAHKEFRSKDKTPRECRSIFKNCRGKSVEEKLDIYQTLCKEVQPVFHKFFETHFRQPSVWYERKRAYTHSVATTSMCGYILGIGDRHPSNILIDKQTAEVIHIDFGIAFEQGKCLPTPETVPFRLSRDIVDGMGVSGIEGLFKKSCEKTMEVLRANSQTILTILEVLLYDPLYFWTLSAAEANKRQTEEDSFEAVADEAEEENKNVSAQRALLRLREKLQGTEEGKPTSVEKQVGALIQQAMDPVNLCRLFDGWQPYL